MSRARPVGTVTFLFSDIERSTELSRDHGVAWGDIRAEHRRLLRGAFAANAGSVIDAEGDAFFVVFARASDAVVAAVAAQRELAKVELVRVRIGVHTTEPHLHRDGYVGVGVTRAARICAAAHGGQIVLSHVTAGVVQDCNITGLLLRDLGEYQLKDLPAPERLFQVEADGIPSEFPPLVSTSGAGAFGTLLMTDLVGWTRLIGELGDDAAAAAAAAYHRIVAEQARANGGRQVERVADHTLSVFAAAEQAVTAAAAARKALRDEEWIAGVTTKPPVCAAIHSGRFARPAEGQFGSPAVRVVRLCELAEPGQILVSHASHAMLEGRLLGGLTLRDLGERALPGTGGPTRVYEVVDDDGAA